MAATSIKIPLDKTKDRHVVLFIDEIQDYLVEEIVNVLQREFAPLHVWRECAVEFHRQNSDVNFQLVLNTITNALSIQSKCLI